MAGQATALEGQGVSMHATGAVARQAVADPTAVAASRADLRLAGARAAART